MAKLTLPLGASSASGQLGKAWVFFPWKGLNLVRTLVVPANPKTAAQQTQRGHFSSAVDEFHAATYTTGDVAGWRRYALTLAKVMTYFNAVVMLIINALVEDELFSWMRNVVVSNVAVDGFTVTTEVEADHTDYLAWGLTPSYMPNLEQMVYAPGPPKESSKQLTGMPGKTQIYFYCYHTEQGYQGRTGVHMQKTD